MGSYTQFQGDNTVPNVLFMPGIFNETMTLLRDAHEYFALYGTEDQASIEGDLKTLYMREMSRITLRLSSIMAWLMAQRAIVSGSIPEEDVERFALDFQDSCLVDGHMLHGILPPYVCQLLDRTHELYERVNRLDERIRLH